MPSNKPTDELLAALPEVGLRLEILGERPGHTDARWIAVIAEAPYGPESERYDAHGATPAGALIAVLAVAGIQVDDV